MELMRILDYGGGRNRFWIHSAFFLRLIISKHLAEDNGVVKVSVIEVYIRQEGS
jgi:hypothetical protein